MYPAIPAMITIKMTPPMIKKGRWLTAETAAAVFSSALARRSLGVGGAFRTLSTSAKMSSGSFLFFIVAIYLLFRLAVILNLFQDLCKITGILNQVQNDTINFKVFYSARLLYTF